MGYSNQQDNAQSKGSKNCLKLAALGCLGSLVVLGGGIVGIVFVAISFLRSSAATQGALERLQTHPQAVEALGEPINMGWQLSGNINISGPSGDANLSIPVSGPRGAGTLYIEAEKQAGEWDYQVLELAIDGSSERIDLLSEFTIHLQWHLPETPLLRPIFATDTATEVEVGFQPSASF